MTEWLIKASLSPYPGVRSVDVAWVKPGIVRIAVVGSTVAVVGSTVSALRYHIETIKPAGVGVGVVFAHTDSDTGAVTEILL